MTVHEESSQQDYAACLCCLPVSGRSASLQTVPILRVLTCQPSGQDCHGGSRKVPRHLLSVRIFPAKYSTTTTKVATLPGDSAPSVSITWMDEAGHSEQS